MRLSRATQTRFSLATVAAGALALSAIAAGGYAVSAHSDATPASTITVARFFGGVSSAGSGLANGTTVTASVDGVACGVGTVSAGQYTVDVQELPGCINPGKKVDFLVNGHPASPQGAIPSLQGAAVQVNLTVAQATPSPSPSPAPTAAPAVTAAATSAATVAPAATSAPTTTSAAPPPPPPPLPPSAGAARTATAAAATPARTPTKTAAATATPKAAVAPVSAQRPATKAAAPALPKTGTGGAARDGRSTTLFGLVLAAAAILAGAGAVTLRRKP